MGSQSRGNTAKFSDKYTGQDHGKPMETTHENWGQILTLFITATFGSSRIWGPSFLF